MSVERVLIDIIGRDKASAAFDTAAASAGRAAAKIDTVGAKLTKAGAAMTRRVTVPLLAIGVVSAKMASTFDSSMTRIQTQAGGSAKDVKTLSQSVLDLSKHAQQGPVELANSLYHLKSVGMGNATAMKALATSSDLAAVGNANLEDTTNALAGAWRTGISGAQNFGKAAATVNAVIGAGNMTMTDFTGALGTGILPVAKTFGLTLKDVGSALALFTDEGVPANAAATRLRMSMSLLGAPSARAEKQLNSIGLTGLTLAEDMRKHNGLLTAVGDLKKHLDESGLSASKQAQLLSHAFGGGRSSSAILSMVNNYDVLGQKIAQTDANQRKYNADVKAQAATPQAQFKVAVSNLERTAIILGNEVLPMFTHLAQDAGGVAQWFAKVDQSSHGMVLRIAEIAAVTGPAVMVLGKLITTGRRLYTGGKAIVGWATTFVVSTYRVVQGARAAELSIEAMNTRSYAAGLKVRSMFVGLGNAAVGFGRYVGSAFRAAGSSLAAIPSAVGAAEGAGAKLAAIGTGAAGAASALGPLAVGVIGVTAAVTGGIALWSHYKAVQAETAQNISNLTSAIESDSGALGANTRAVVVNKLASEGALEQARNLGVSLKDLTSSFLGNAAAGARVKARLNDVALGLSQSDTSGGKAAQMLDDYNALTASIGGENSAINAAIQGAKDYRAAMGGQSSSAKTAAASTGKLGSAATQASAATGKLGTVAYNAALRQSELASASRDAADAERHLQNALKQLDGTLSKAAAAIQYQQDIRNFTSQLKQNKGALLGHSAAALQDRGAFVALGQEIVGRASDMRKSGSSWHAVSGYIQGQISSLRGQMEAAGASKGAVDKLLTSLHLMPAQVRTTINADVSQAQAAVVNLNALLSQAVSYNGDSITIGAVVGGRGVMAKADGGAVSGPGTGKSDSIPARLSNGEHVWTADEVASAGGQGAMYRARAMVRAGMMRFANGGAVEHRGDSWIYDGIRYASRRAALNARTRSQQSASKPDTSAVGTAIGNIGSAASKPIDVASVGIDRISQQIARARVALLAQVNHGLGKSAAAAFRRQIDALSREAQRQLSALKVKIKHADVSALKRALGGTVADTRAAVSQILADTRAAGVSSAKLVSRIDGMQGRIIAKQQAISRIDAQLGSAPQRQTAYDRLAAAKQNYSGERDGVRSSVLGSFDVTTAGAFAQVYNDQAAAPTTGSSILASLKAAVAKAKQFSGVLRRLAKMHLAPTLLSQLANAGPAALAQAQALVASGAGTVGEISREYKALGQYGTAAGTTSADAMFGAGVKSAQKLVDGLLSHRQKIRKAMRTIADDMADALDKAVAAEAHKHSVGVAAGHHTHKPKPKPNHNGHHDKHHARAAIHVDHLEVHGPNDTVATAQAVVRRLAHMGGA